MICAALIGEDGVRDVTIVRATMLRPSISRPYIGNRSAVTAFAGCDACDGWQTSRRYSPAILLAFAHVSRWWNQARDGFEDRRLAARARYPAPAAGLSTWYRCATNGLLLCYIAGGDERYRTREWPLSRVFVDFNRQYVRSGYYGEVWEFSSVAVGDAGRQRGKKSGLSTIETTVGNKVGAGKCR